MEVKVCLPGASISNRSIADKGQRASYLNKYQTQQHLRRLDDQTSSSLYTKRSASQTGKSIILLAGEDVRGSVPGDQMWQRLESWTRECGKYPGMRSR